MATLRYLPEAIPTTSGWAHPLTGEQIDVNHTLEDPIDYYKPNSGSRSFIDPEGDGDPLAFAVVRGNRVRMVIHTAQRPKSVTWNFGDDTPEITSSIRAMHIYATQEENETYTVEATILDEEDEETVVSFEVPIAGTDPSEPPEDPGEGDEEEEGDGEGFTVMGGAD